MRERVVYLALVSLVVFVFSASVIGFATSCDKATGLSLNQTTTELVTTTVEESTSEDVTTTVATEAASSTTVAAETTVETTPSNTETTMPTEETTAPAKVAATKPASKPSTTKPKTTTKAPTKKPTATKAPTKAPTKTPTKPAVKPKTTKTPTKAPTPVPSKGYAMVKFKFSVTMRDKDENGNYIKHSFTKNLKCVTTDYHSKDISDYHVCDEDATLKAVKAEVGSNYRNYSASKSKVVEFLN